MWKESPLTALFFDWVFWTPSWYTPAVGAFAPLLVDTVNVSWVSVAPAATVWL